MFINWIYSVFMSTEVSRFFLFFTAFILLTAFELISLPRTSNVNSTADLKWMHNGFSEESVSDFIWSTSHAVCQSMGKMYQNRTDFFRSVSDHNGIRSTSVCGSCFFVTHTGAALSGIFCIVKPNIKGEKIVVKLHQKIFLKTCMMRSNCMYAWTAVLQQLQIQLSAIASSSP